MAPKTKKETLGGFLKERRSALKLTLREFSHAVGLDPSNYSKYERDVGPAPKEEVLKKIARKHGIQAGRGSEWRKLTTLAAARRWEIPGDVRSDRLLPLLPALYQHLREHELPDGEDPIDVLVRTLTKSKVI